jgi:type VI secretion system secreted protein Hcp
LDASQGCRSRRIFERPEIPADEELHRHAAENLAPADALAGSVDTISALAWNQAVNFVGTSSGSGLPSGKRQHKPFVITKTLDKSSPVLLKACATGTHFPELRLDAFRTRQGRSELYLTITLEDVMVGTFQTSGGAATGASVAPEEQEHIAFTFTKTTFNYRDFGVVIEDDLTDE